MPHNSSGATLVVAECAAVALTAGNDASSSQVSTSSHLTQSTSAGPDEVSSFASAQINQNGAVHRDEAIRIAGDRASGVTRRGIPFMPTSIFTLLTCPWPPLWGAMDSKVTVGVRDQRELLSGLANAGHAHNTSSAVRGFGPRPQS